MQGKGMDYFLPGAAALYMRRTPSTGELKLHIVGAKKTGRIVWALAGQDAWTKQEPDETFKSQRLPYRNEDAALEDALRIFPSRSDFERFASYGFNGETVQDMRAYGEALDIWPEENSGITDVFDAMALENADPDRWAEDIDDVEALSDPDRMRIITSAFKRRVKSRICCN